MSKIVRALHVIPAIAPRYGGPSAAVVAMTDALNRCQDVEAEIATTDADGKRGHLDGARLPAGTTPVHLFRRDFSEPWKYSAGLGAWLARHTHRYDVVHVPGCGAY